MTELTHADACAIKCLLVDDLEENLLALSALLRRDDVEMLKARSGAEALELLLVHDVALALLDVQMPEMDGFELAELMRGSERTRHVPIIFVTAGARDQQRVFKGYEAGAVDFLLQADRAAHPQEQGATCSSSCTARSSSSRSELRRAHRDAAAERDVHRGARPRSAQPAQRDPQLGAHLLRAPHADDAACEQSAARMRAAAGA